MKLGPLLRSTRLALGKTLREVESATGISNGYLSQLESDAVKQPSPHHLHKLSDFYHLDYANLMELVGYVAPRPVAASNTAERATNFPGLDELTEEDRKKIEAYIEDLRDARRVRAMETDEKARTNRAQSA